MLDASRAADLLKSNWRTPSALAQQLYSLVTSKQPRVLEAPLTIKVEPGQTALRIVQGQTSATQKNPSPAAQQRAVASSRGPSVEPPRALADFTHEPSRPATPDNTTSALATSRQDDGFTSVSPLSVLDISRRPAQPSQVFHERPPTSDHGFGPSPAPPRNPTPGLVPIAKAFLPATPPGPKPAKVRGPEASGPSSRAAAAIDQTPQVNKSRFLNPVTASRGPSFTEAYKAPVVSIEGPVSFSGKEPVQFDLPPLVLNTRTQQYDPITDYDLEEGTHIPRGRTVFDPLIGKIKSATVTNGKWKVTIYPAGKPPNSGDGSNPQDTYDVDVIVPNAPTAYKPKVGDWIGPILEKPSQVGADLNDYYYFPAGPQGQYAYVNAPGISAAAGAVLGSGSITICSRTNATLNPDGGTATCYNAGGSVPSGKYIAVAVYDGDWSTSVSPC